MNLTVNRTHATANCHMGELLVNGAPFCYTLEPGRDVPAGTYQVLVTFSPKFDRPMPLVTGVPGFSGIRIHTGNTAQDTEGCLLVGVTRNTDEEWIGASRIAFERLFPLICAAENDGETVSIQYVDQNPGA